jgi:hypothetical protein
MQTLDQMSPDQQLSELRREWWGSAALRDEFVNDFNIFAAARRAEERGIVSVVTPRVEGGR